MSSIAVKGFYDLKFFLKLLSNSVTFSGSCLWCPRMRLRQTCQLVTTAKNIGPVSKQLHCQFNWDSRKERKTSSEQKKNNQNQKFKPKLSFWPEWRGLGRSQVVHQHQGLRRSPQQLMKSSTESRYLFS